MKKLLILFITVTLPLGLIAQTIATVGETADDYFNLQDAFSDINAGGIKGAIILQIVDNVDEGTGTAILNASGTGAASYTSIQIYPTGSYTVTGSVAGPLIDLNGADNVTIDGRINATGSTVSLTITNTSLSGTAGVSTIRFINDATNNTVRYCNLKGSSTASAGGVLFFSTTTGTSGNDGNSITYNNISCSSDLNRPVNAVYSLGTSAKENSGNTISNNSVYDFLNRGLSSNGIFIHTNNTTWTLSGNSFYEAASFTPSADATYNVIQIDNSGTGYVLTGNYIGGNAASCSGTWTKSSYNSPFNAINLNVGTGTATSLQNNTIKNFSWSNAGAASWTGINIAGGDVNIGTTSGNTIGASTGTSSIVFTGGLSNANLYSINISGSGTINCQNNIIGSIRTASSGVTSNSIYIINSSSSGIVNIRDNFIGSTDGSSSNSINASSVSTGTTNTQVVYGIYNTGNATLTVDNNTISKLTNATTNTGTSRRGLINGIASTSSSGSTTITNNTIYDLTIANANTAQWNLASVGGIVLVGNVSRTISGNVLYNLSNTRSTFGGYVNGIYYESSTGTNTVNGNFIHSLSVNTSSTTAKICGIQLYTGSSTFSNNIISLGESLTSDTFIYGIYETGIGGNNNKFYFNSIYIGGSVSTGTNNNNTFGFASFDNGQALNIRNNVFYNARSNSSASSSHYAIFFSGSPSSLVSDYNDYYVSGTGGVLGYYSGNKAVLPIVPLPQDANSYALDPVYTTVGGTNASDFTIGADLIGITGTGISTDYGSDPRNNPTMGAWERLVNKWKGNTSTAWYTASNWTAASIPLANANIIFDDAPVNNLNLDASRSVNNITNGSNYNLVINGKQLTIKGTVNVTGTGLIDASSSSSLLIYGGTAAQTIDGADFTNGKTYSLTVDNTTGVTITSNFTVDNTLTINSGKLLTISAGTQLNVPGTINNNATFTGLVIKSDANGNDGKLVNDNASVPGTVELYLSGGLNGSARIYHYFVPPVQSMTIGVNVPYPTIPEAKANLGITNFTGDLLSYSEVAAGANKDNGWQFFDGWNGTTGFSSLLNDRGYNLNFSANDKITFKGNLNGAAHSFGPLSFTNQGFNLVGNPYPCNYDLNGITLLTGSDDGVDNTVYFNNEGGYAVWNVVTGGTTGYSDIMPPMQGFMVKVTQPGKTLTLPVGSKTSTTASPLRSKGSSSEEKESKFITVKKVKLALSKGSQRDETIVCMIDDASPGFDSDYDGYKFLTSGSTTPAIYSEVSSVRYAINTVQEPATGQTRIPLSVVIKSAGEHKIDITEFENIGSTKVALKHGSVITPLSQGTSYTFTSAAGTFTDFEVLIGEEDITTGDENSAVEKFKLWYNRDFVYVNSPSDIYSGSSKIIIYDLQGKPVLNDSQIYLVPGQTIQVPVNLSKGVYVVRVISNNQSFTSKIVVF
jgi:hypothetical protein